MTDVDVWQAARQGLLEDVQVRVRFLRPSQQEIRGRPAVVPNVNAQCG